MIWFLIGLGLLAAYLYLKPQFAKADRRAVAAGLRGLGAAAAVLFGLFLSIRGAIMFGGPLIIAGLAVLFPSLKLGDVLGRFGIGGLGGGGAGEVDTPWVRMRLDRAAGPVDGVLKQGAFAGRRLAELAEPDLRRALAEVRAADAEGAALLEAYIARRFSAGGGRAPGGRQTMSEEEALAVLGLERGASPDEVQAAYKRLMVKVHPDQGGSSWLAAKLNAARERLIGK